jgi:hypothetical protein
VSEGDLAESLTCSWWKLRGPSVAKLKKEPGTGQQGVVIDNFPEGYPQI